MRSLLQYTRDLFSPHDSPSVEPTVRRSLASPGTLPPEPAHFRHPRATREAKLGDALVAYEFKRGKRRTIGFSVGPDGLVVTAPKWVPLYEVHAAVLEKSAWIVRKLAETRARHERLASNCIEWKDGATLPFLGQPMVVVLDPLHTYGDAAAVLHSDLGSGVQLQSLSLHLGLPKHASADQMRDAVQAWLMRQANRVFIERLDHFAPLLNVRWRKLSLSNATSRWGSARSDGSIRLHWRLVHFRMSVIDYVVAHELSHLRVMDHSPRFWDTVRGVIPDYADLRVQLKDASLPQWQ